MKRVGVFGGSFDPVHFGHLILAEQCREQARLDEVWVVPAARAPHKRDEQATPFALRVEMLRLALSDEFNYRIDELEAERAGPSYTADTLDELHRRHPNCQWFYLMGGDSLPDFPTWHEPARIIARAGLVVMDRPGWPTMTAEELSAALKLPAGVPLGLQKVDVPLIDLASRDIRRRVRAGRSIRFMLPPSVEKFIAERGLYRP